MGAATTADGQTVYLPDSITGGSSDVAPPPLPQNPVGQIDPSMLTSIGASPQGGDSNAPVGGWLHPDIVRQLGLSSDAQNSPPPATTPVLSQLPTSGFTGGVPNAWQSVLPAAPDGTPSPIFTGTPGQSPFRGGRDVDMGTLSAVNGKLVATPPPAPPPGQPQPPPDAFQQAANKGMQALDEKQAANNQLSLEQQRQADEEYQTQARAAAAEHLQNLADQKAIADRQAGQQQLFNQYQKAVDARANFKLDDSRKWNSLGTGGKIFAGIMVGLSGVGAALQGNGAQNLALKTIDDAIKQDIDSQKFNYEQLGNTMNDRQRLLADYRQQTGDIEHAQDLLRAQRLGEVKNQLELVARGHAGPLIAARAQALGADIDAERAKLIQGVAEGTFDRNQKTQQLKIAQQSANTSAFSAAETARHNRIQEGFEQYKVDAELEAKKAIADAKAKGKLSADEAKLAVSAPATASGGQYQTLRNKDGSAWQARNPEDAVKKAGLVAAMDRYHALAGDMIRNIRDNGGSSDYFKSKEWQQQQSKLESAIAELHDAYDIKRFGESTVDFFKKMGTAGVDPTSFVYDASTALATSDRDLQSHVNSQLRAANYDGPPIALPDVTNLGEPTKTEIEKQGAAAVARNPVEAHAGAFAPAIGNFGVRVGEMAGNAARMQNLKQLFQNATSKDPDASAQARRLIEATANDDSTPANVRQAAQDWLSNMQVEISH